MRDRSGRGEADWRSRRQPLPGGIGVSLHVHIPMRGYFAMRFCFAYGRIGAETLIKPQSWELRALEFGVYLVFGFWDLVFRERVSYLTDGPFRCIYLPAS